MNAFHDCPSLADMEVVVLPMDHITLMPLPAALDDAPSPADIQVEVLDGPVDNDRVARFLNRKES